MDSVAQGNKMQEYKTGALREDKTGKGRCDLLPMCALLRLSKHYETGTEAHGERNWENGLPMHSFLDSAIRHLFKYMDGQNDEDHLAAAAWNILGAMWTEEKKPEMQDIPTRPKKPVPLGILEGNCVDNEIKLRKQLPPSERCDCYEPGDIELRLRPRCNGTKERDYCSCGGDRTKCDFYNRT